MKTKFETMEQYAQSSTPASSGVASTKHETMEQYATISEAEQSVAMVSA